MMPTENNCPICNHPSRFSFSSRDLMFDHYQRYDYNACTDCELIFQNPKPSSQDIAAFYPDEYDVYEEGSRLKKIPLLRKAKLAHYFGYNHLKTSTYHRLLARISFFVNKGEYEIPFVPNGSLLDIGCGNGRFLHGMQQLGWQVKGVEFNDHAVNTCRKSRLDVHHGDLFSAQFDDASFDVINLSHVIEHVPDPKALFIEMSRLLKPKGLLVLKTPNSKALGRALFDTKWFANEVPRHLYLFSQKNLATLGKLSQLQIIDTQTSSTPKIILNSVDYVINNRGKASKRIGWRRMLAKPYVWLAAFLKRGDEILMVFQKQT